MKEFLENKKGITLIALVVTIIILIILASVSISLILGENGIITKAKEARDNFQRAAEEEGTGLNSLLAEINEKTASDWTYDHTSQTVTNGTLTLNIGDIVNDTSTQTIEGFDGKWRVLGAENGQLLLTTDTDAAPFKAENLTYDGTSYEIFKGFSQLQLEGANGYNNGVNALNAIGALYNNSKLEKGRSIKVEDVNRITGYNPNNVGVNDPNQTGNGTKYGQGKIDQYGNHVTYKMKDNKVWYSLDYVSGDIETDGTWTQTSKTTYMPLGEDTSISNGSSNSIDAIYYNYYGSTLTEKRSDAENGVAIGSSVYEMLFGTTETYRNYWLASPCVEVGNGWVYWDYFAVFLGSVDHSGDIWSSDFGSSCLYQGVRPVVSLKSGITPVLKTQGSETVPSTYEI